MTAPIASGGSEIAGWALHPLESAALPRRAPITAIAPIGLIEQGHPIERLVDRLRHLALQDGGDRLPAKPPVALAPLQSLRSHGLHKLKCPGKLRIVTAVALGVLHLADLSNPPSTPSRRPDTNLRTSPAGVPPLQNARIGGYHSFVPGKLVVYFGEYRISWARAADDAKKLPFPIDMFWPKAARTAPKEEQDVTPEYASRSLMIIRSSMIILAMVVGVSISTNAETVKVMDQASTDGSFIVAQTSGTERRGERRDTRQNCRGANGAVGADKRHCKQQGRQ